MAAAPRIVGRLALRNLRRRWWQALLLLVALCLATTSLALALAVDRTGDGAWERVWRATNGPHVLAKLNYAPDTDPAALAAARRQLADLARAPGVTAAGAPTPQLFTSGQIGSRHIDLAALVRGPGRAAVDQPQVTAGRWLDGGDGVVLEDGLAGTSRVRPGDTVTIAGLRLPVRGIATTVAFGRYPMYEPGRLWVSPAVADRLRSAGASDYAETIELRLADPDGAPAFVAAHPAYATGGGSVTQATSAGGGGAVRIELDTWQQLRDNSHDELSTFAIALLGVATMLAALTVATAAVLVTGRMAAQIRQVGTLKAVGLTPGQVTAVVLVEYLALAVVATAVGAVAGTLLSPMIAHSAPSLYGPAEAPPITGSATAIVAGIAIGIVVLAAARPALVGTRRSTVRALASTTRPPRHGSRVARVGSRLGLPLPAVLALRSSLRRPGRTVTNAAGLAVAIGLAVVSLALRDSVDRFLGSGAGAAATRDTDRQLYHQLLAIAYTAMALLLALAVVNAIMVAVFAARDGARNHAILRVVGATPRQTVTAFVLGQLGACLLACAAGIPLGLAVFDALRGGLSPTHLSAFTYATVTGLALAGFALVVAVPARVLAAQRAAPQLTYE